MRYSCLGRILAALLLIGVGWARGAERPAARPAAEMRARGPLPGRVVLTWAADPASTMAVSWRTNGPDREGVAELQLASDGPLSANARRVAAVTQSLADGSTTVWCHSAEFTELAPDTLYAYRVGDGVNWSEWFHFRTASREAKPFSFLYFGDVQNDIRMHWSRLFREAFRAAPQAAFTLYAGDIVDHADRDDEWGDWYAGAGWVNASTPVVAAAGNHEYVTLSGAREDPLRVRALSRYWRAQFAFPVHGPAGLEETCYYLDYQGARIVVLNSNQELAGQLTWLRGVLAANPMRWTILTFHHPFFSPSNKRKDFEDREQRELRELWKPVLDEFKVDLVLAGHDHTYARSGIATVPAGYPGGGDPLNGTVYVVSVSGTKMYRLGPTNWAVRVATDAQLYQVITVDGDELRYEARAATSRLYDQFILRKRRGAPNELIELPANPPRTEPAAR